ncbi:MAG: hypothetical protein IJL70_09625 [Treponema sp.]|nr:hypothetical protein [Treponema sp.]
MEYLVTGQELSEKNIKNMTESNPPQNTIREMLSIPQNMQNPIKEIIHNTEVMSNKKQN